MQKIKSKILLVIIVPIILSSLFMPIAVAKYKTSNKYNEVLEVAEPIFIVEGTETSKINAINNVSTSASAIYAHICIEQTKGSDYKELKGQDDISSNPDSQSYYKGLCFSTSASAPKKDTSTTTWYTLQLFEKINGTWKVPVNSRVKFKQRSLDFNIDGGIVK